MGGRGIFPVTFKTMVVTMNKMKKAGLVAGSVAGLLPAVSQAAVNAADLTPISTEITNDIGVILPYAFGVLAVVVAAIIGFKLVKKFTSAAT